MDKRTAYFLSNLTTSFYRTFAKSFSATRQRPWQGWFKLMDELAARPAEGASLAEGLLPVETSLSEDTQLAEGASLAESILAVENISPKNALRVLDIACGNGRFGSFLVHFEPSFPCEVYGVDNCEMLVAQMPDEEISLYRAFMPMDIGRVLLEEVYDAGPSFSDVLDYSDFDVLVCFGFMHHVPSFAARAALLRSMIALAKPCGIVALSLWQFVRNSSEASRMRSKTSRTIAQFTYGEKFNRSSADGDAPSPTIECPAYLDLDLDDYLLGWQNREDATRYCHNFSDDEIKALIRVANEAGASLVMRFNADGASGQDNAYVVFKKHPE